MPDDRKNVKVPADVFEQLNETRQTRGLTWPSFLADMERVYTSEVEIDIDPDAIAERIDHTAIADRTAAEVARRLRR